MQNTKQIFDPNRSEPAKYEYKKSFYTDIYEVLQTLRKDEVLCDIRLETNDGGVIFGHKVVLASSSPYFHAMFTHFSEKTKDLVVISQLDSCALQLLIDFVYSGTIIITENNVEALLSAANLLQLEEVKEACCDFVQAQLRSTNCIGINTLADLYSCTKLLTSSELYIQQHFSEVVEGDEFLSLSSTQMVKFISSDELTVPSEEKIFESVILWVKHDLDSRKQILPLLMEHVRLPLTSNEFILKKVVEEPLIDNCLKCKDYVTEALHFHLLKSDEFITIPRSIRTKPRQPGGTHNVILVFGGLACGVIHNNVYCMTEWYDPKINRWQNGPKVVAPRYACGIAVVKDNFVLAVGGYNDGSTLKSADLLDLSSETPHWKPTTNMLVERRLLGIGVIKNDVYAVGGFDGKRYLNSAEVYNCSTQEWHMVSSMSTRRCSFGIGVLNNVLYAVGGFDGTSQQRSNSVECYHPSLDKWTPIAEMCVRRSALGVGIVDGVLYAVGGTDGLNVQKSVEVYRPSTGVWSIIPDMHLCRRNPGIAVLDGLLYVIGGSDGTSSLASVEIYNPKNNTWTIAMVTTSRNVSRNSVGIVAIDRPRHFKTY